MINYKFIFDHIWLNFNFGTDCLHADLSLCSQGPVWPRFLLGGGGGAAASAGRQAGGPPPSADPRDHRPAQPLCRRGTGWRRRLLVNVSRVFSSKPIPAIYWSISRPIGDLLVIWTNRKALRLLNEWGAFSFWPLMVLHLTNRNIFEDFRLHFLIISITYKTPIVHSLQFQKGLWVFSDATGKLVPRSKFVR